MKTSPDQQTTEQGAGQGAGGQSRQRRFGRRKVCPFCADKTLYIDYKTPSMLKRFITERGKIVPRRISGTCAPHQRTLQEAIKRARIMALMPFSSATSD